jgi:membrane associated rhomboid family serine protease
MKKLTIPMLFVAIMWLVYLIFGQKAIPYGGIEPRHIASLRGIILSPFIHVSFEHLIANTLPIFILLLFMAIFYERFWLLSTILIIITGDTLLWLIGRPAYHVGASLAIFGLIGFFLASALFRKQFKAFLVGLIVGILYGGALIGIIPSDPHVSWEGHLSGFIAGIFWAYVFRNTRENKNDKNILKKNIPDTSTDE